jgi:sterol desaturase/sphingolipid hydroxylase (fatty acid hydroxylase superfamily)
VGLADSLRHCVVWSILPMLVVAAVLRVAELVHAHRSGRPADHRDWARNMVYIIGIQLAVVSLYVMVAPVFLRVYEWTDGGVLHDFFAGLLPGHPLVRTVLGTLGFAFVWDLSQYWFHRAEHASPVLWQLHVFHHSDPDVNSTTAQRVHLAGIVVQLFVLSLPLQILFGPNPLSVLAGYLLFFAVGFYNHVRLDIDLGPLTRVISGPRWHRVHHSIDEAHMDCNFAAFFPVIDMAFGTYRAPEPGGLLATGERVSADVPWWRMATIEPFTGWSARLAPRYRRTSGRSRGLRIRRA